MENGLTDELEFVDRVVKSGAELRECMDQLIAYCEEQCPGTAWEAVRALDIDEDIENLTTRLKIILAAAPPPQDIRAYWFGIYNPDTEDGPSCALYVSGAPRFDQDDETFDWACPAEDSYLPEDRFLESRVLHELYQILQESGLHTFPKPCKREGLCGGENHCWLGDYVLSLGYSCLAVREICTNLVEDLVSPEGSTITIAVGYDSGDGIVIGSIEGDEGSAAE
jgi:hypothetical protein